MAGQIASFFASLGFKADYKELDKFEKRLKQLQGAEVRSAVKTERQKTAAVAREYKARGEMLRKVTQRYRRQEVKDLRAISADRKQLRAEKTNKVKAINDSTRLSEDQKKAANVALGEQYGEAERRLDREREAILDKYIATRKKRAEFKRKQAEKEQRRIQARGRLEAQAYAEDMQREQNKQAAIQRRGRLEAQAYAENESRARRAHKAELRRIRELEVARRRLRHQVKRKVGYGVGAAAAMGFGGAMSVQSYQQSLGIDRGLTAATGSAELGQQERQTLNALADKYGVFIGDAGQSYASMLASARGTKLEGGGATRAFESVMAQARVMNLSTADTQGVFRAVNQIVNKGSVMAEELECRLAA